MTTVNSTASCPRTNIESLDNYKLHTLMTDVDKENKPPIVKKMTHLFLVLSGLIRHF